MGAEGGACGGGLPFTCGCGMSSWDLGRAFCLVIHVLHSLGVPGVFPGREGDQLSKDLSISSLFKERFSTLGSSKDDSLRAGL